MLKIWERYFLSELAKTFFLFLLSIYGLYVLIDYSSHAATFHHHNVQFQWKTTILYYACEFAKRLEVLLPFALLIATVRTLCSLNIHNELTALLAGGISLRRIMRPFLYAGLFCTALLYLNTEYFLPYALRQIKHIDDARSREKHKNDTQKNVQHLTFEDGSTLVFQRYDSVDHSFYDAYWIRTIDDIYRVKYLYPNMPHNIPKGFVVEHLARDQSGILTKTAAFTELAFNDMHFSKETLFETMTPADELALSDLWNKLPADKANISEKEAANLASFYHKLLLPWLCLLVIIGPAPLCLQCTRRLPVFFIYSLSIFGLVGLYLIMEASFILGERQVLPAFWIIVAPFVVFAFFLNSFAWKRLS